jgi:hypothetical protein
LPFPLSLSGQISVPVSEHFALQEQLIEDSIVHELKRHKVTRLRPTGSRISFRFGPLWGLRNDVLDLSWRMKWGVGSISSGSVEVASSLGTVSYHIRFTEVLIWAVFSTILLVIPVHTWLEVPALLVTPFVIFTWVVYIWCTGYSYFYVRRLLRKALQDAHAPKAADVTAQRG